MHPSGQQTPPEGSQIHYSPRRTLIRTAAAFNLLLVTLTFLASSVPLPVLAQDGKDDTQPVDGVLFDSYPHPNSRGALAYSVADRWERNALTYYFHNCPSTVRCNEGQNAVRAAFEAWADLSSLSFTEVSSARQADIELEWSSRGPELGYPGDVLAFAYFPSDGGDVFFDDTEPWQLFTYSEFDLFLVAAHEIGHALGIDHSSVPTALMYPVMTRQTTGLTNDDAQALQALYGGPQANPPDRDNTPNNLPSDEVEQVSGVITDSDPYELWEFEAFTGETLTITMQATSGDLIPYVGLLTADQEEVLAESWPSGSGNTAQVTYTFNQGGTYIITATREGVDEGRTEGDYVLLIETAEDAGSTGESVPESPESPGGTVIATVRSYSDAPICELYISLSSNTEWGANRVSGQLTNGNYLDVELAPGQYDFAVVTCAGEQLEQYEVQVASDLAIEIYDERLNVYVYGD